MIQPQISQTCGSFRVYSQCSFFKELTLLSYFIDKPAVNPSPQEIVLLLNSYTMTGFLRIAPKGVPFKLALFLFANQLVDYLGTF